MQLYHSITHKTSYCLQQRLQDIVEDDDELQVNREIARIMLADLRSGPTRSAIKEISPIHSDYNLKDLTGLEFEAEMNRRKEFCERYKYLLKVGEKPL